VYRQFAGRGFFADDGPSYPCNQPAPHNNTHLAYSHAAPGEIDEGPKHVSAGRQVLRDLWMMECARGMGHNRADILGHDTLFC